MADKMQQKCYNIGHHKNYFANKCLKIQNDSIISDGHNKLVNVDNNFGNIKILRTSQKR